MKKQVLRFPILLRYFSIFQFIVVLSICIKENQSRNDIYFISVLSLLVILILLLSKLTIIIESNIIKYSFFPFLPFYKTIKSDEIKNAYIGNVNDFYSLIGWGIRLSKKYGTGYILDSEKVLYIELVSGKKIILSIKKEEDFSEFLR